MRQLVSKIRWPLGQRSRNLRRELKKQSTEEYWRQRERSHSRGLWVISHRYRLGSFAHGTQRNLGIVRDAFFQLLRAFCAGALLFAAVLLAELFLVLQSHISYLGIFDISYHAISLRVETSPVAGRCGIQGCHMPLRTNCDCSIREVRMAQSYPIRPIGTPSERISYPCRTSLGKFAGILSGRRERCLRHLLPQRIR